MEKIRVAADTSALLSLKLCNILENSLKFFHYFIGDRIREELKEISETEDALGKAGRSVLELVSDRITLVDTENFEKGEEEALQIYREKETDLLISDDIEFVKAHKKDADFSALPLLTLVEKGILTKDELIERLENMFKKRGWEKRNLIYIATIAELRQL